MTLRGVFLDKVTGKSEVLCQVYYLGVEEMRAAYLTETGTTTIKSHYFG